MQFQVVLMPILKNIALNLLTQRTMIAQSKYCGIWVLGLDFPPASQSSRRRRTKKALLQGKKTENFQSKADFR